MSASQVRAAVENAFRDFVTNGVPASGAHNPVKAEIRHALGALLESTLSGIGSGLLRYATKAAMDAVTDKADGQLAYVYADATAANNTVYQWDDGGNQWDVATWYFDAVAAVVQPLLDDVTIIGTGNLIGGAGVSIARIKSGGAIDTPGTDGGLTIPNGSTGATSYIQPAWEYDGAANAGRTVRLVLGFTVSGTFTRTLAALMQVNTAGGAAGRAATITSSSSGNRRVFTLEYEVVGDELDLRPALQIGGAATASVETVELTDFASFPLTAVSDVLTAADEALDARVPLIVQPMIDAVPVLTTGNIRAITVAAVNADNGAEQMGAWGLEFPSGTTGDDSFIQSQWLFDGAANAGRRVRMDLGLITSATFTRSLNLLMQVNTAGGAEGRTATLSSRIDGTSRVYSATYEVEGDETDLRPVLVVFSAGATATDETVELAEVAARFLDPVSDVLTSMDDMFDLRLAQRDTATSEYAVTLHASADGSMDYEHVADALEAITDASPTRRYRVMVHGYMEQIGPGDRADFFCKNYVDIEGADPNPLLNHIHFENPNDAPNDDIAALSTLWLPSHSRLINLRITGRNCRYAVHMESSGNALYANTEPQIINCDIEHLGNEDAVNNAYQVENQFAIGAGYSSGQKPLLLGTRAVGPAGGFSFHTNIRYRLPVRVTVRNCLLASTAEYAPMRIAPAGSRQADTCSIEATTFVGGNLLYGAGSGNGAPWLDTAIENQPADQNEVTVTGFGNKGLVFRHVGDGQALKLESNTTGTASKIEVGGAWVPLVFGDKTLAKYRTIAGDVGLAGSVIGWGNINGATVGGAGLPPTVNNALRYRLGNRVGNPLTGTVKVDGGALQNITLSADYSAMSNAAIIAAIQLQIAGATLSAYAVDQEYVPLISDEEEGAINTAGTTLVRGTFVAWDSAKGVDMAAMEVADAAAIRGGVLLETVPPNKVGRIKSGGAIHLTNVRRSDAAALVLGDMMSVGASGQLAKSASKPVMMARSPSVLEFL